MVANYTNKHSTFNKGKCIGHMEPTIDKMPQTHENSVSTQEKIDNEVQLDTFMPFLHHLILKVQHSLGELIDSFKTHFVKDEMSIGMANLTKKQVGTSASDPEF